MRGRVMTNCAKSSSLQIFNGENRFFHMPANSWPKLECKTLAECVCVSFYAFCLSVGPWGVCLIFMRFIWARHANNTLGNQSGMADV